MMVVIVRASTDIEAKMELHGIETYSQSRFTRNETKVFVPWEYEAVVRYWFARDEDVLWFSHCEEPNV